MTPQCIQWTIPSLSYQTRRKNPLVHKMTISLVEIGVFINVYILIKLHIGNVFDRPPRQKTSMVRVLTGLIFKGIEWGFRKYMCTKIPGMVNQGLLAPQGICSYT